MMKVKLSKGFFIKTFFWFLVVFFVLVYNEFARFGLPDAKGIGNRDDQSIAFFILATLLLFSTFKKYIARSFIAILFFSLTFFAVSNWWYYDFYRDFLTPGAVKLAIYAEETTMAWDGLKFKKEALFYFLSMIALMLVLFRLDKYKPKNKTLIITSLIFFTLAIQQQIALSGMEKGGLKHRGVNHISYFIKGFVPRKKFTLNDEQVEQIKKALPEKNIAIDDRKYPLYQALDKTLESSVDKKNVIIVVMESVRMAETGLYGNSAQSSTPNLDQFASQSMNFKTHYANSNQTVRGEVAILCSALDYMNGGTYSMAGDAMKTNCLPSILNQYGYETYWIHGYKKKFFNRENFFPKLGFKHLIDREIINVDKDKNEIGWGVNDREVFKDALDRLEQEDKPFFAEILTLSNHYPYLWDWGIPFPEHLSLKATLEEDEDNLYPAYKQGIYYTDNALGEFLERFKASKLYENTLLVVTSDHGIWTFPDEILNSKTVQNELKKNEMYFRLPLLVHAKNLPPAIFDKPVSQVDIAPTILDYLGIDFPNAFLGDSLLTRNNKGDYPIYFMASGSYGVRRDDQYCYPIDTSDLCNTYYRTCESSTKSDARSVCFTTTEDLLISSESLNVIEVDKSNDDVFIDLSQQFLDYGFIPAELIL